MHPFESAHARGVDGLRAWVVAGLLLTTSLFVAPGSAQESSGAVSDSTCSDRILSAVTKHFEAASPMATGSNIAPEPVAQVCKAWPYDPTITLAAVAWSRSGPDASPGERRISLDVAMLSSADNGVLAAHRRALEEDAVLALQQNALRLDTARYDLAPDQRAFGLVMSSSAPGPSCPERGSNDELTLYLRDGAALRPVLSTYLEVWDFVEGAPCVHDKPLVTDAATITSHLESTRSHGLADVTLKAQVERTRREANGEDAPAVERSAQRTLRYDGTTYQTDPYKQLFFWAEPGRND